jgi:hypothetical protein
MLIFYNFSYGLAQLRALGVPVLDVTSLPFRKEVTKKRNQDVPSWISLSLPLCKEEKEKNIKFFTASLAAKLTRAAGVESKIFC